MEVKSNRIGDIRVHYQRKLIKIFSEREADHMLFIIFEAHIGLSRAKVLMNADQRVSESELLKVHWAVKELLKEKPLEYVLGNTEFYGLQFQVNSKVLIPRPETEELVERAIQYLSAKKKPAVLDVGTGSGCIAISIKKNIPLATLTAIDVSEFALEMARINSQLNDTDVDFRKMDLRDEKKCDKLGTFDLIISNPPYVRNSEKSQMKKNVLDYEPVVALFVPDDDPLLFYRLIGRLAQEKLKPEGRVLCEINQYLADETTNLFVELGFSEVEIYPDLKGNQRFVSAIARYS